MAIDDYGLGIAVPDDDTPDFELRTLLRDALNTIARLVDERTPTVGVTAAIAGLNERLTKLETAAPAPAPPPPADYSAAIDSLRRRVEDLDLTVSSTLERSNY